MTTQPQYLCIDLKSFYASVACMDRSLDPLKTRLVVADKNRTDKIICLAVSPALKALGVPGRPRLFEVRQRLEHLSRRTGRVISFIIEPPQMAPLYLGLR
jgi:DNA polymerase V